ncbi:ABC transporter substrate-binding protein [Nocardia sp. KC 131]|uniref:ABC transporter substrate-binding protein n=1 Tax=Nocardia arseniciresistens TaxID=3392119 RepID=UPI00398E75AD
MDKWKLALTAGAMSAALLVGATACADENAGSSGGSTRLSISATGADSLPFMAILQAGIDKGWFQEAGVDVNLYSGGGGGNTLRVVTSGDADMAIAGNTSVILAARQPNSKLKIVAPWFQLNDFSWIAPAAATLDGATLGFSSAGSSTELIVKGLEARLGVRSQAVGTMGDNWTAARAGRITAGWAMQPFIASKVANEGAKVLVDSRKILGDMPADLVAVNTTYAEQNPENITKFFKVVTRLNDWVVGDPKAAAETLAPLVGVSVADMQKAFADTPDLAKGYSLKIDPKNLDNLSSLMVGAGQISEPVDWSTTLDQRYLPEDDRAGFK